jgi:hypothetical protein
MADVEQERSRAAQTERRKAPCQVVQLAQHRGVRKDVVRAFYRQSICRRSRVHSHHGNGEGCIREGYRVERRGEAHERLDQRWYQKLFNRRVRIGNGAC